MRSIFTSSGLFLICKWNLSSAGVLMIMLSFNLCFHIGGVPLVCGRNEGSQQQALRSGVFLATARPHSPPLIPESAWWALPGVWLALLPSFFFQYCHPDPCPVVSLRTPVNGSLPQWHHKEFSMDTTYPLMFMTTDSSSNPRRPSF